MIWCRKDCLIVKVLRVRMPMQSKSVKRRQQVFRALRRFIPGRMCRNSVLQWRGQTLRNQAHGRLISISMCATWEIWWRLCRKKMKMHGPCAEALKVEYEVLPAILDFHQSKDNELLVHPEEAGNRSVRSVQRTIRRNLCASAEDHNEMWKPCSECDEVVEHTYHAAQPSRR